MLHSPALQRTLSRPHPVTFVFTAGLVAFVAYGCIYAFRKPFTAAGFTGLEVWGVQYKIALVIAQVAGYALSKFVGIRLISALGVRQRAGMLLLILTIAALSLLGFAFASPFWGVFWMFLNGIPLGMAWGVVFSYLEGRRVTEALAALLCINFIISSGFVKTVGKWVMLEKGISEFSMPLVVGLLFLPVLLICIWLLEHLPPPDKADKAHRTERKAMTAADRKVLFQKYAPGLLLLTSIYLILTIIRDVRDNFAIEIWTELGFGNQPAILTTTELPIALLVLVSVGAMTFVSNNFQALWLNHGIVIGGAVLTVFSTVLFRQHLITPVAWFVLSGAGIFLSYILFNGVLFDRLLAAFRETGNAGFLIYVADAVGYLGSVVILLWRNFGRKDLNWVDFFSDLCLYGSVLILLLTFFSFGYIRKKKRFLRTTVVVLCVMCAAGLRSQNIFPAWEPGMLDIHHISTGRGNAAFFIFPDSTTLLIDAGEISDTHPRTRSSRNGALRPDSSRSASEWICDYIRQFHPSRHTPRLDYAVITHFHDDHFGEWDADKPISDPGGYALTGIMGVGNAIPIRHLLDRGTHFPIDVRGPAFSKAYENDEYHIVQTLGEYGKFIQWQQAHHSLKYDTIQPGVSGQIGLKNPADFPDFRVKNIASGGRIWTGYREGEFLEMYKPGTYPGENPLSVCLKISYGAFDYFTGGDISGIDEFGQGNLQSMEAQVAPVVGAVDVATLNHHGNRDSQSPFFVRTLRPRVWIQQCWSSDHPGEEVLRRITSGSLYPGERSLFTTDMLEANVQVIGEKVNRAYSCLHGHVVVRVMPGGKTYEVFVLNDFSTKREVIGRFGPFESR